MFDFKFFFQIDDDRGRMWRSPTRNCGRDMTIEEGDVKNRVNMH